MWLTRLIVQWSSHYTSLFGTWLQQTLKTFTPRHGAQCAWESTLLTCKDLVQLENLYDSIRLASLGGGEHDTLYADIIMWYSVFLMVRKLVQNFLVCSWLSRARLHQKQIDHARIQLGWWNNWHRFRDMWPAYDKTTLCSAIAVLMDLSLRRGLMQALLESWNVSQA